MSFFRTLIVIAVAWLGGIAGGCAALPRFEDGSDETADNPVAADEEIVPEELDEPGGDLHAHRPVFPKQGWWCSEYDGWLAPERVAKGYTVILPGVEGTSLFNISIARGLIDAGHESAIEINDWTTGYWPLFIYHLQALERNKAEARRIADRIVTYQKRYPGRPVNLIGHSGGGALAVLVLEALPIGTEVTQAILLAPALSPDYDLTRALIHTEQGITNFHSAGDALYLMAGTLALGTLDRQFTVSAGAVGFRVPESVPADRQKWYESQLHQTPYRLEMMQSFNLGGHLGPVNRKFVAEWVAPRLTRRFE